MAERIDRLEVAAYTVGTDRPEADGTLEWNQTTLVLVKAASGDTEGLGWTYGAPAGAAVVRDALAPVVVGLDPMNPPRAWELMVRRVRNDGRQGLAGYAISAVDIALWDLKARLLGVPLHRLFGAVWSSAPIYASGGFTTYDDAALRSQLTEWVGERRIPRVKLKIGQSWGRMRERDLDRMRYARELIGQGTELFVDANGAYSRKEAIRVARAAADAGMTWFEEPVSSDDLDGLRLVRDAVPADVTAGEYGFDLYYFRRMCEAGAVDCLQIDVTRCGGFSEWFRAAAVAASYGLSVSAHCAPHLHVPAAVGTRNLRHIEYFHDHARIEHMLFDGALDPAGGELRPDPARPGLGLEFKGGDAERHRVA